MYSRYSILGIALPTNSRLDQKKELARSLMKTVLVLTWFYHPFIGGAELFVRAISERLSRRFRFTIVTAHAEKHLPAREAQDGVTVLRVGTGHSIDKFIYPLAALRGALRLESVDLVHAIMVNASAVAAYAYLKLRSRPSLLTLQEGDSEEYVRDYLGPFFPIYPRLHRPFDRIHAISSFLRDEAVRHGADPATISVVPNGVDTATFDRSAWDTQELCELRRGLDLDGKRIIISVSRLVPKNALDDLVRAMPSILRDHPDAALLLVGDGSELGKLEELTRRLGIENRVRFTGSVEHRDTAKYLLLSDVFVRPSASEGLGSAFLEAMACGVPVVATPVGGIPDFLRDGETGLLCRPHDPESVASAVHRSLADLSLAERLSRNGRELVQQDYDWDKVAARIGDLYEELLAR